MGVGLIFENFVHFLKKKKKKKKKKSNFRQSISWIWSEMFQGTKKSQFYYYYEKCAKINIFHVLSHKSINT